MANQKSHQHDHHPLEPGVGCGGALDRLDREDARIYLQSLPAEEVTRDFLQELLMEHQSNHKQRPAR